MKGIIEKIFALEPKGEEEIEVCVRCEGLPEPITRNNICEICKDELYE